MSAPDRRDLPLPDYDHLPVTSLQHRVRSLSSDQVQQLIDYEEAHARRVPALEVLRQRLEQLAEGAQPSEGTHDVLPEEAPGTSHGSPASPETSGASSNPPPHGVPHQPGKPKGDYQPGQG